MGKNKILSSILAGLSFCLFMGSTTNAIENNSVSSNSGYVISNIDGFEKLEILGSRYDLTNVNSAVIQSLARGFDAVNSKDLSDQEKNEKLSEMKELLEDYFKNPGNFENFPVTLDLGPTTLFREEVESVQKKISDLKNEQNAIKNTKMVPRAIEEKVNELQDQIVNLSKWINYSVKNFKSAEYQRTFDDAAKVDIEENDVKNNQEDVYTLLTHVYSTPDYSELFKVSVNSDGNFVSDKSLNSDLVDVIKKNLEFENFKVRDLLERIKRIENLKISQIEMDKQIKAVKAEIESVKAYGLSQEIILLNLEKENVKSLRISTEFMQERIKDIDSKINERVTVLKEFKQNSENNKENSLKNSDLGKTSSYFGYVLQDGDKFGVRLSLTEGNDVLIENMNLSEKNEVKLDILTQEQKQSLKKVINQDILKFKDKINSLQETKATLENKNQDSKYYFVDSIEKEISVLNNDIKNYELILSKI